MRPPAKHLTIFYVALSVGGACGGLFNSIIAPAVFDLEIEFALPLLTAGGLFLIQSGAIILRQVLLGVAAAAPLAFLIWELNQGNTNDANTLPATAAFSEHMRCMIATVFGSTRTAPRFKAGKG
ncbi:hypothetical protein [Ruegeria sp. MALMAid1280]|uniref:hypothetical protein n=1 Tax=Ruegeria sp. MALMAid1280 TaxID=3411634 RepID=UPI003B9F829F